MSDSYQNFSTFNTIGTKTTLQNAEIVPKPPKLISNDQDVIVQHKESLKEFLDEYTQEILTRKDFRLLNNIFNPQAISEQELDEMEVVGDGFEHMNVIGKKKTQNDFNNTYFEIEENSKLIDHHNNESPPQRSMTRPPQKIGSNHKSIFSVPQ